MAQAARTFRGVTYRSGFEAGVARDLFERGHEFGYGSERVWYSVPRFSRVDWAIRTASGKTVLVESKGWFPPSDRQKVAAIVESNPDLDYRLLFQKNEPSYIAWARKHGIQYAVGTIPDEWFNE